MNWYKQIKIASPPMIEQETGRYTDIGHYWNGGPEQGEDIVTVWQMDPDFSLTAFRIDDAKTEGHHESFSSQSIIDKIAGGRLAENGIQRITSLSFNRMGITNKLGISFFKYDVSKKVEYMKKRIITVVDEYFNNPEIRLFD